MTGSILDGIGNTPLVELRRIVPGNGARVLVKVEGQNPSGSMKDRTALAVIDDAVAAGELRPGMTVVEYTGGSTGTSLALVCAARGYAVKLVTSDVFSREKRNHMRALGAEVIEVPSEGGGIAKSLFTRMFKKAEEICAEGNCYYADQLQNPYAAAGYHGLGEEIRRQSGGIVDAFVQVVGTGHSFNGVAEILRRWRPDMHIVAVEPEESPVLSGGAPGAHRIEGIGIGQVPPAWRDKMADAVLQVSTGEAMAMARRLAREEALFAGISSGANVVAALRTAENLGPGATVVTLLCDSGLKYLSTELYAATDVT